jgi:DNA mismatch endonuclease (patch repair protein)
MPDIVTSEKRSQMMSGIKGKNTKPELLVRKALHKIGFRYLLHVRYLVGKPDLVFPKYKAVLFINGCFWHGHNCDLFKWPSSNVEFWQKKISRNRENDKKAIEKLLEGKGRVGIIWECALKGKKRISFDRFLSKTVKWLKSETITFEIRGNETSYFS